MATISPDHLIVNTRCPPIQVLRRGERLRKRGRPLRATTVATGGPELRRSVCDLYPGKREAIRAEVNAGWNSEDLDFPTVTMSGRHFVYYSAVIAQKLEASWQKCPAHLKMSDRRTGQPAHEKICSFCRPAQCLPSHWGEDLLFCLGVRAQCWRAGHTRSVAGTRSTKTSPNVFLI